MRPSHAHTTQCFMRRHGSYCAPACANTFALGLPLLGFVWPMLGLYNTVQYLSLAFQIGGAT